VDLQGLRDREESSDAVNWILSTTVVIINQLRSGNHIEVEHS